MESPLPAGLARICCSHGLAADFGYSWTYALNSMDVVLNEWRETIVVGGNEAISLDPFEDIYPGPQRTVNIRGGGGHDVTLTLPDGRRTTFVFDPLFRPQDFQADARWTAPPGVSEKLELLGGDSGVINLIPTWEPYWQSGGFPSTFDNHDLNGWKLTTLDGTEYHITRGEGRDVLYQDEPGHFINVKVYDAQPKLTAIVQRSGDKIHITDTGVTHYDKNNDPTRSMFMQRDAIGRITAIFDPNSGVTNDASAANAKALVKYVYNRNTGNLIQVHRLQDREAGNYLVTKYHYDHPKFPHYITSIEDPRGIPLARNEYDDAGWLTAVVDADGKRTEFIHNTTNRVEIVTDRLGNTNSYVYDLRGNVTFMTNALNVVAAMGYDDINQKVAETNALGTAQETWALYAYDDKGNQTEVVTSPNHTNSFVYDGFGSLLAHTDPLGNVTTNGYDGFGNLTNTVQLDAEGNPVAGSSSVYENGHLVETRNFNGELTASFDYGSAGNLTSTTDANGVQRYFTYDDNGNQTSSYFLWTPPGGGSPVGVTNYTVYDAQGRAIRSIDPLGNTNYTFYNALGKVDYTIDKFGNTNSFLYDPRGNLIRTTHADGLVTYTVYDDAGRAFLSTDRNGITATRTEFDAAGRATNVVRLTNAVVTIEAGPRSVLASPGTPISTNATEYFDSGWVKSRTGPDGQKTTYAYWPDGQTMYVTNALNQTTFYAYDLAGRQEYVTDALNRTNHFHYDAVGRMVKTIFHDGTFTTNIFNHLGQRVGVKDQAGLLTQFGYDVSGQLTNVIKPQVPDPEDSHNPAAPQWAYKYDDYGRLTVTTDPKGRSTTNTFDAYGREVTRWLSLGQTNWTKYNSLGQVSEVWDFKKQRQTFVYDQFGRVATNYYFETGATYPSNSVVYLYNHLGQLTNITERSGEDAGIGYVAAGGTGVWPVSPGAKLLASLGRVPSGVQGGLLALGLCGVAMACLPREKRRAFALCLVEAWRAQLHTLSASTGERARPGRSEPRPRGSQWGVKSTGPGQFSGAFVFAAGRVEQQPGRLRSPQRLRLPSYGWRFATLITIAALLGSDPHLSALWTANAQCNIPENYSTETTRITTYAYDVDGRLAQKNSPEGVINYEYDLATGRHIRTCTANSETAYGYDELGRLQTVTVLKRNGTTLGTPEVTTYTYTAVGSRATVELPNNVVVTYEYDSLNRLTNLTHVADGSTLLSQFSYQLDATGRRTNAVEILQTEDGPYQTNTLSWAYDGLYRLTNEVCLSTVSGASYTNQFQYDKTGNRWSQVKVAASGTTTITNQYNANDQLLKEVTRVGGTLTATNYYNYDANGSVLNRVTLSSGGVQTVVYGYDLKNKLSSVTTIGSGGTNYFTYNDAGIRVRTTTGGSTKYFLVDANNHTGYAQVLEEFSGATMTRSYVIGDDVLAQCGTTAGSRRSLLYDGHGNTRQLVDNDWEVTSRYNYDAYGQTLGTSSTTAENAPTSLLYCGEQFDADLKMYNLRARFYDPATGTFHQRDTHPGNNFDPQSLHKYAFGHSDPVNMIDPSGHAAESLNLPGQLFVAAIIFALVTITLAPLVMNPPKVAPPIIWISGSKSTSTGTEPMPQPEPRPDGKLPPVPVPIPDPDNDFALVLYRGVPREREDDFRRAQFGIALPRGNRLDLEALTLHVKNEYVPGGSGVTSWTPIRNVAVGFAGFNGIVLEVDLYSVTDKIVPRPPVNQFMSEHEVLLKGPIQARPTQP